MNKFIISCFLLCFTILSTAQNKTHIIKTDCNINELFKGEGFVFESLGYEYSIDFQRSVGFRIGWDVKTSKLKLNEEWKATNYRNIMLALEYHFFPFRKNSNSGVFISPELYYSNGMNSVDNEKLHGYGLNASIGYRQCFKPIILDCALYSGYGYSYQEKSIYKYKGKEIMPLGIKVIIGFMIGK